MITIRTDKGYEFARSQGPKSAHITLVFFVTGEPTMRDYVFRGGGRR